MKISLLQLLIEENSNLNLKHVLQGLEKAYVDQADLVVLPELWNVPFVLDQIKAHQEEWAPFVSALQKAAKQYGFWIVGGTLPRQENGKLFNSCPVINDQGQLVAIVDKCHLLEVHTPHHDFYECEVFSPGQALTQVVTPWGTMGILICYDNRFPEAARLVCQEAKFLIAPANFNGAISPVQWKPLFQTRAMENEVFVVAMNPAKAQYGSFQSYGHSLLIHPQGKILKELEEKAEVVTVEIDVEEVNLIRKRAPFWTLRRHDLYSLEANKPISLLSLDQEKDLDC